MRAWWFVVLLACSAPATLPELVQAEHAADRGDTDGAIRAYREAQIGCKRLRPERRGREDEDQGKRVAHFVHSSSSVP